MSIFHSDAVFQLWNHNIGCVIYLFRARIFDGDRFERNIDIHFEGASPSAEMYIPTTFYGVDISVEASCQIEELPKVIIRELKTNTSYFLRAGRIDIEENRYENLPIIPSLDRESYEKDYEEYLHTRVLLYSGVLH